MGESLVSKGADVLAPSKGWACPIGSSPSLKWHLLSKGYRVNIPEPDTWMLCGLAFSEVGRMGHGNVYISYASTR